MRIIRERYCNGCRQFSAGSEFVSDCPKCGRPRGGYAATQLHYVIPDTPGYQSPIDGRWIEGRKQRRDDLRRHGCRPWEGQEQERKEAAKQRQYLERQSDERITESVSRAFYSLDPKKRKLLGGY